MVFFALMQELFWHTNRQFSQQHTEKYVIFVFSRNSKTFFHHAKRLSCTILFLQPILELWQT